MSPFAPEKLPDNGGTLRRVAQPTTALVVGGGLAGVAAAIALAERGVDVTLLEAAPVLGGRVSAWDDTLASGEPFQMGRGFHAFFRQYYNLRSLLRRVDPTLSMLTPLEDYPILGPSGAIETFSRLPRMPPFNVIELTRRTHYLRWRDLMRVDARAAMAMLSFDIDTSYEDYDHLSARQYLDSLRFPPRARAMLFNVFAHSFFNPEGAMSAGELLMMFHFYFTGNREGLLFDVLKQPFSTGLWAPLTRYLEELGVNVRLGVRAERIEQRARGYAVFAGEQRFEADQAVLGLSVPALQTLMASSPGFSHSGFQASLSSLDVTQPFAVWRLWLDRRARADRPGFAGTAELGRLDNVSLFNLFEDESRAWANSRRGAVLELHAYAVEEGCDEGELRSELWEATMSLYPELRGAQVLDERFLMRRDCPAFAPGSHAARPTVATPFAGLSLAGDFVKLPMASALMERATASGLLAANHLLAQLNVAGAPVYSVPRRGLFGGMDLFRPAAARAPHGAPRPASHAPRGGPLSVARALGGAPLSVARALGGAPLSVARALRARAGYPSSPVIGDLR